MTDSDEYGFFCDLETVKTMEYDHVEYYVVTKRTHWEVCKKPTIIVKPSKNDDSADEPSCCFNPNGKPPKRLDTFQSMSRESDKTNTTPSCFHSKFGFLSRLPRDVYYSFMVCTATISCIYIAMGLPIEK